MHKLYSDDILAYSEKYSSPESDVLYRLNRETHLKTELPVMLSGHLQGRLLSMLSKMIQPASILEIGTFTGYSALCLAEGLKPGGKLITLEMNPELKDPCEAWFREANMDHCIEMRIGQAASLIETLQGPFDLVFIDADKTNYCTYFDQVIDKVQTGGYILADNVLFHGDVLLGEKGSKNAKAMNQYNEKMRNDPRLESVLLPIRDGIMISRKI
ncbi:MAG TPA: O-methyltransferase [Chitinophagaceae bacterium]|nr:O-methyltransferase [Chitinophagaceae bacterium]HNF72146.1 O-methyltransferase [Chitinophagaceae bacterium]